MWLCCLSSVYSDKFLAVTANYNYFQRKTSLQADNSTIITFLWILRKTAADRVGIGRRERMEHKTQLAACPMMGACTTDRSLQALQSQASWVPLPTAYKVCCLSPPGCSFQGTWLWLQLLGCRGGARAGIGLLPAGCGGEEGCGCFEAGTGAIFAPGLYLQVAKLAWQTGWVGRCLQGGLILSCRRQCIFHARNPANILMTVAEAGSVQAFRWLNHHNT